MKKIILLIVSMIAVVSNAGAQTDCTSRITNPSFESEMTGWVHKDLNVQGNDVFSIKSGNKYLEKWTGRGGAVGSASVSQELLNLPPGNYELTAAAQNIQEDTPTAAQRPASQITFPSNTTDRKNSTPSMVARSLAHLS